MNRTLFQLLIGLALFLFVSSFTAEAQNKIRTVGKVTKPTIVGDKPGVYISFERLGKRTPLRDDEGGEGVWLRLNNNMRYSISFCIFGLSEKSSLPIKTEENIQIGLNYDVILNARAITDNRPLPKVPIGYPVLNTCQDFSLKAGKSFRFAVPKEHLAEELSIEIRFQYEWENDTVDNPTHFVYFNSASIPKK